MKELFEDLLGVEAQEILVDTLQRRAEVMAPGEVDAVHRFSAGEPLTEMDKLSLNELVTAMADDFGTRRRSQELQRMMREATPPPVEDEEDWLPEDEEEVLGGPDGSVGPLMGEMLEDLKENEPEMPGDDDFEDF